MKNIIKVNDNNLEKGLAEDWEITCNSIKDFVSIHDKNFKLVKVNKALADALKMKPKELIGKTCYEAIHGAKEPWPNCPYKKILKTRKPSRIEFFDPHLGIHLEVYASPIFDKKSKITGFVHVARDVTKRKEIEEELRESEEHFRYLSEATFEAIAVHDKGVLLDANDQFFEMFGYEKGELIGKQAAPLIIAPEFREFVKKVQAQLMLKVSRTFEVMGLKKDGTKFPMEFRVRDSEYKGQKVRIAAIADITERKKMEWTLRGRLKELTCLHSITELIERKSAISTPSVIDEIFGGILSFVPPAYQYPEITCARIVHDEKVFATYNFKETRWKQSADIKTYGDKVGTIEVYYLEETPKIYEGPFLKEERDLINAIAERLSNIIEHKNAEELLKESEEKLRSIFESSPVAITTLDSNGKITECNQAALDMIGYSSKDELIGKSFTPLFARKDRKRVMEQFKKTLKRGWTRNAEYTALTNDGYEFPVSISAKVLTDASDMPMLMAITEDITERKRMENISNVRDRLRRAPDMSIGSNLILDMGLRDINMDAGAILLVNHERNVVELRSFKSNFEAEMDESFPLDGRFVEFETLIKKKSISKVVGEGEQSILSTISIHCAPILIGKEVSGIIAFGSLKGEIIDDSKLATIGMYSELASTLFETQD